MSLEGASEEVLAERERALMAAVEAEGGKAGNTSLMRVLGWSGEDYWSIRDRLVDQGRLELGKGKGGSVRTVQTHVQAPTGPLTATQPPSFGAALATPAVRTREDELYDPVAKVLRAFWAKDKRYRHLVVEVTARQGKRETGGKWTRPDITVASMTTLLYVPGKLFDVTTFEVKPRDALDVTAVYEALAHRRAATRAYVWLHIPNVEAQSEEPFNALVAEAKRHGIGIIAASDPDDYDTWEEHVEAARVEPDPQKLNDFITVQFSAGNKDEILNWLR